MVEVLKIEKTGQLLPTLVRDFGDIGQQSFQLTLIPFLISNT